MTGALEQAQHNVKHLPVTSKGNPNTSAAVTALALQHSKETRCQAELLGVLPGNRQQSIKHDYVESCPGLSFRFSALGADLC